MYITMKIILGIAVIACSTQIGILLSKKYVYRLDELDEIKNNFKIMENKIKYTYEPLEDIFSEVAELSSFSIKELFIRTSQNIKQKGAEKAWKDEIKSADLSLKKEDKNILKEFGNLLGKTNKEGQINQIQFVNTLLDRQIEKAKEDKSKNETVYKKLGLIFGIGIVVVLI